MKPVNDDNELMNNYVLGDEAAFGVLFSRYSKKLMTYLRMRLGFRKEYLSEEIFQKTWLKVHAFRKLYQSSHPFSSWLYTIALNTLRDEVTSASERLRAHEIDEEFPSTDESVEEQYISKENFEELKVVLGLLKENQRIALLLSQEDGLSSQEIARTLKMSDAAVRQLISRARKEIKRCFLERQSHE